MKILNLCICLIASYAFASEPMCSKFSYDESLLEKMIRTELKFEKFQNDFTQLRDDVKLAVKQMTADMQAMMNTVKSSLKDVQKDRLDMLEDFEDLNQTTNAKVEELMQDSKDTFEQQRRQVDRMSSDLRGIYTDLQKNITDTAAIPVVGFKATDVTNMNPSNGDVLVFPTVLFNKGAGYNPSSGVFLAPVDGLYLLTVQICMTNKKYITISIMVDEKEAGRVHTFDDTGYYPTNTADAIVYMREGGKAYVKVLYKGGRLYTDIHRLLSFSGCLINKGE